MIDIILHITCSFLIVLMVTGITGKVKIGMAVALILGICKEVFLDANISSMDLLSNVIGVMIAYDVLRSNR